MENIWIFILIAVVANVIGSQSKAKQKKRQILSSAKTVKEADYNYKNQIMMPEIKDDYRTTRRDIDFMEQKSFLNKTEEVVFRPKEVIVEAEEVFDLGLSELQHAIVMAEILNKPLALRKK